MRIKLVEYQGVMLTEDTIQALLALALRASGNGWELKVEGPYHAIPELAGREVFLRLDHRIEFVDPQTALDALWSMAVKLRFTPWLRYPVADAVGDSIFHYMGPWQMLHDRLMAEGRGHLVWPSLCVATQCDAGVWTGDNVLVRSLQAQLHRIGYNAGPVDGLLNSRTNAAIEAAGLKNMAVRAALDCLLPMPSAIPETSERGKRVQGNLLIGG